MSSQTPRLVPPAPDPSLGEQLRAKRLARGLSQRELAGQFSVTQQTIGAWEKGGRPESTYFEKLAAFLDLEDTEAVVALLDTHMPQPGSDVVLHSVDLIGKKPEEIIDIITQASIGLVLSGAGLTDPQVAYFEKLLVHYEQRLMKSDRQ